MAEQKKRSQAQKAASSGKKTTSSQKSSSTKKSPAKNPPPQKEPLIIPSRATAAVFSLVLSLILILILLFPEGVAVGFFLDLIMGLVGKVSFIVAIPALLYLFIIQAFSGRRPVKMRTICLISFILLCGCISHLTLDPQNLSDGLSVVGDLYVGGSGGYTGGVLCGGIAMGMQWLFGSTFSFIILIAAAILTLLGAFQITLPSIIRAIQNRPRAEWEEEEQPEPKPEPAAMVVNHLATKRIEYVEHRRQIKAEKAARIDIPVEDETPIVSGPGRKPVKKENAPKADDIMRQIADVETPVAAAGTAPVESEVTETEDSTAVTLPQEEPEPIPVSAEEPEPPIPAAMPVYQPEAPLKQAPKMEKKPPKVTANEAKVSAAQVEEEIKQGETLEKAEYCFPPIDLLKLPAGGGVDGTMEMRENSRRLNETLASFKIEAHIINVTRGPSVTRYEVELEKGVRLNKLTAAADDIALSLGASGVRIAPVPGKISVVGIEVPNRAVTTVSLREVIDSNEFNKAKSKSTFAVGKDIGGSCIVGDIGKLPHMLIAGTTGSGKSVCMNSIIISLLYKASPDDVKLIMVDPKMVELGIYNGIPHLLIPVVTDPKKAAGSLQWAVTEMMRRYKSMSDAGVRDLESYNSIIESQEVEGVRFPKVVVIIDELADLMLVAAKEVEESICRIAQMGRAAGIHLVIATQRPSADVITGLMKANIPSRIAFAVASAMESRIILDTQGAEKLVGKGDMLFAPIGNGKPKRVQGCFVSDAEVEAVASYVKNNYTTTYDQQVIEEIERKASQAGNSKSSASDPEPTADELDGDEMLPAAVDVILETGQASVSMLQRRLKLGYARAARIVDEMEEKGIVGPFQGSKPRAILVTREQWEAMRAGRTAEQDIQMEFDDYSQELDDPLPEELE